MCIRDRADWRPDATVLLTLMKLGFPLALQHILIAVGGMVLQLSLIHI